MRLIKHISITLASCLCLALPVAAQKNIKLFRPVLERKIQHAQPSNTLVRPLVIKTLKIINFSSRPSVHIVLPAQPRVKNSVRLVPSNQVYPLLHKLKEQKMFVPHDLVNQTKALYRGMTIANIDELKNILTNGLELNKSNYRKQIFTAYDPLTAVLYSQPTHFFHAQADLPVLIKIPFTPSLEQYTFTRFPTALAFHQNLPANAISDVWILLEVNKKPDWYKAILDDGQIVLFPAHGQLQDIPHL